MNRRWSCCCSPALIALLLLHLRAAASATTYEVGPGKPCAVIGAVPWESLEPGDTVLIHWRPEPYREKWVICRQGRPDAPITVRGVAGTNGQLPVIDGDGATARAQLDYWGDVRSVIKIGGARNTPDLMPAYIVLENLDICNAGPSYSFTGARGKAQAYHRNAAAVHIEKGEHVTIRNCTLHHCGNGLVVSSNDQQASRDILIEGNYIYDNGNARSGYEHNVYSEAIGITFQYNRLGPLRLGSSGNNLKDRSAGLVIRYNWIAGGDKELDLVDGEDSALVRQDPQYRKTFVYGNVIIELDDSGHPFIVHYGGDGARLSTYRKGTLYFYNNTVVSLRHDYTVLFRLSSDDETCDCRNNIVYVPTAPKAGLAVLENKGGVTLSHNWFKRGWQSTPGRRAAGNVRNDDTSISGEAPGFVDWSARDVHLAPFSPCRGHGTAPGIEPFLSHPVKRQYVKHQSGEIRASVLDLGALETRAASAGP